MKVINEIGSFVTLDVPGPRTTRLQASSNYPASRWAGRLRAGSRCTTSGGRPCAFGARTTPPSGPEAALPASSASPSPWCRRDTPGPCASSRRPTGGWVFVTSQVRIVYPATTEASTREIVIRKRVLVVDPRALVAGGVLATAVVAWVSRRRRRRRRLAARARRRGAPPHPPKTRQPASLSCALERLYDRRTRRFGTGVGPFSRP